MTIQYPLIWLTFSRNLLIGWRHLNQRLLLLDLNQVIQRFMLSIVRWYFWFHFPSLTFENWCLINKKCVTENGKELTRVCVIDFDSGIVVFDQLVKPSKPILDYLTRFFFVSFVFLSSPSSSLFSKNQKNFNVGGQELRPRLLLP